MRAALPANESQRLRYLHRLGLLDTPSESDFDDITLVAARACGVPMAAITLIDEDRQWLKSCVGMERGETSRELAFCAHTILDPQSLTLVEDARLDQRFSDNPQVTDAPGLRFYAGAPLTTEEGFALGALCLVDTQPRQLSLEQQDILRALARQVMQQIRLRETLTDLERTRDKLHLLADSVPVLIGQLDAEGRYVFCNRKYRDWWGLDPQWLLGKTSAEVLPGALVRGLAPYLARALKGEEVEFELEDADGRVIAAHYLPHRQNEQLAGIFVLASDISQRKQMELLKNAFVSSVSHELRTPLTSISGALGLLLHGQTGSLDEPQKKLLDIAHKNSQRLMYLINDLLDMEKLLAGKMRFELQPADVTSLLEKALYENTTYASSYQVRFALITPKHPLFICVDEQRFLQAMANLLSNAVKYSPADSLVRVECQQLGAARLRVSVIDRGPGVPEDFRPNLFQKFSQADNPAARRKGGTGLGLAITRELVEKMGGQVGFSAPQEGGSCFYLEFPLAKNDAHEAREKRE